MKRAYLITTVLVLAGLVWGQGLELKPYGFVKGDMVYATNAAVKSFAEVDDLSAIQQVSSDTGRGALGFTAQHTRFGLKGSSEVEGIKIGGQIELDFFGYGYDANARPRIRLAYASVMPIKGLEVRMGQQWDVISSLNPNTNNTNGNMWYAGNIGFRRAQLQVRYSHDMESVVPGIILSVGEASKGQTVGDDNRSKMPMFQGRLGAVILKKFDIGFSGVLAQYTTINKTNYKTSGFGIDWTLPAHKLFALNGELNMGTNFNNANLFTIAGSTASDAVDCKSMGLWLNAVSNLHKYLTIVVGFGMDQNKSDNLVPMALEKNQVVYGDVIVPVAGGFSLALEFENINTSKKNDDTKYTTNVIDFAAKVAF